MDKNKMIFIGDVRIRANNIKNYGIANNTRYFEKIYKKEKVKRANWEIIVDAFLESPEPYEWKWYGEYVEVSKRRYDNRSKPRQCNRKTVDSNGQIAYTNTLLTESDFKIRKEKCLYITTYQRDNFVFWESEAKFDILKKCNEIDEVFM